MVYRTDDPGRDFDAWEADQERELERLPVCSECGERILDDFLYEIYGELICEECLRENYRKMTSDLMV